MNRNPRIFRSTTLSLWCKMDVFDRILLVGYISLGVYLVGLLNNVPILTKGAPLVVLGAVLWLNIGDFCSWLWRILQNEELKPVLARLLCILGFLPVMDSLGVIAMFQDWLNSFSFDEFGSWAEWAGSVGDIILAITFGFTSLRQEKLSNNLSENGIVTGLAASFQNTIIGSDGSYKINWALKVPLNAQVSSFIPNLSKQGLALLLRVFGENWYSLPLKTTSWGGGLVPTDKGDWFKLDWSDEGRAFFELGDKLRGRDLSGMDLRSTIYSFGRLIKTNFSGPMTNLRNASFVCATAKGADFSEVDLTKSKLFVGDVFQASPFKERGRDAKTGEGMGLKVVNHTTSQGRLIPVNFTGARLTPAQYFYLAQWSPKETKSTLSKPEGYELWEQKKRLQGKLV